MSDQADAALEEMWNIVVAAKEGRTRGSRAYLTEAEARRIRYLVRYVADHSDDAKGEAMRLAGLRGSLRSHREHTRAGMAAGRAGDERYMIAEHEQASRELDGMLQDIYVLKNMIIGRRRA
jgi:hypothetical protein